MTCLTKQKKHPHIEPCKQSLPTEFLTQGTVNDAEYNVRKSISESILLAAIAYPISALH